MLVLNEQELDTAVEEIKKKNIVIFPTETVYGIGADCTDSNAVEKIFIAKGRPNNNPLIVHLSDIDKIKDYAIIENDIERKLIESFMPGPFTIILKKKSNISSFVTCGLDTVGIRIPSNEIAHKFLEKVGVGIAAPSANLSSKPSGTNVQDIINDFDGKIDYIIEGGESRVGLESTVVKIINGIPTILRPGFITKEDIESLGLPCNIGSGVLNKVDNNEKVESPGVLYKHYAPNSKCLLIYGTNKDNLLDLVKEFNTDNSVIVGSNTLKDIPCKQFINYGNSLEEIAHSIFTILRSVDKYEPDLVIIEGVEKKGLGLAIMNRLLRSVSFNYIEK